MCFSAGASFGTSVVLASVGIAAIKRAGIGSQRLFAAIPLLFAAQQLAEGLVWLAIMHSNYAAWQSPSVYFYMIFAYVVWPLWVPLSILLLEVSKDRKKILRIFLIVGVVLSAFIICCLLLYPVHATVYNHHIVYTFDYPPLLANLSLLRDGFYFIATLPAAFISTRKRTWIFGSVLIASYIFSKIFFADAIVSVWCYFAAALSIVVFFIVR